MLGAILGALGSFIPTAMDLISKAVQAKKEEHAKIVADLQAASAKLVEDLAGIAAALAADDAATDAALDARFPK
jgi:hypothetical protein